MTEAEKYAKEWGINLNGGDICFDKIMLLSFIKSFAAEQVKEALDQIEKFLPSDDEIARKYGIHNDVWFSAMHYRNKTQEAIDRLKKR